MDKHTLQLLEFDRIRECLKEYAFSASGQKLIETEEILTDEKAISVFQSKVSGFRKIMETGERFPVTDFPDIVSAFKSLKMVGSYLEPEEFHFLHRFIVSAVQLKKFLKKNGTDPLVLELSDRLPDLQDLASEIARIIDRDGKVKDGSIPELASLRRSINRLKSEIEKLIHGHLNNPLNKAYLQSVVPTQKDGRTVIPVKANHRGKIKGIVHEVSSSGSTVYIEPEQSVEMNNEIVRLENEYRQELIRILRALTGRAALHADDIFHMESVIGQIDSCCSRARHGIVYNSFRPETGDSLELINARHPLVKGTVVPLTIRMKGRTKVLIITGPNTGGKTVTLKTVGLMALMHQFGLQLPCDLGSRLPVFDNVFADIGDEQSIEQCLSTFSGHIRNMSQIIGASTADSLVLLDELGSGTDPEEGVAIAMSILDHFIAKGCRVVTSTHHGILKNYGYTRPEAVNACMEFDPERLLPTYRIIMGIPGESYALPIAERHGIPRKVIDKAKAYLNEERTDISGLIKNLSEKHKELILEEERQQLLDRELTEKLRQNDLKELRLKQKEIELREHGLKDLKTFLSQSRKELENIIRDIREGDLTKDKIRSVKDYLASIEEKVNEEDRRQTSRSEELDKGPGFAFTPGMMVRIKSTLSKGTIIRKGKKDTWVVETDTLKAAFSERELEPLKTSLSDSKVEVHAAAFGMDTDAVFTLDVRGERLEEALKILEKQMDGAILKGLKEFMIIHGKGEGVLMHGIHEYLRNCQYVKDYFFSTPEEGGFGKTIVVLRD